MTDKFQEIELRHALEGLEELATFMSYRSDCGNLRILSVETVQQANEREQAERNAKVIPLASRRRPNKSNTISKKLRFQDRYFQS